MVKKILTIIGLFLVAMIGGIFADQIFWPYFVERPLFYQYRLEQAPVYVNETKQIVVQENTALQDQVDKIQKTVTGIRSKTAAGQIMEGSGLVLTSDGMVVTFSDLVPSGSETSIFLEGSEYKIAKDAKILKRDTKNNLVLIKIEKNNLASAGFADMNQTKLAERVFLIGVIFSGGIPQKTVNEGIIKSFDENYIRTNIFEKYTLSGSPLFDIQGNVLGLNTIDKEGKVIAISAQKIKSFAGF
jgi:S1-C subfamily serine protease